MNEDKHITDHIFLVYDADNCVYYLEGRDPDCWYYSVQNWDYADDAVFDYKAGKVTWTF